MLKVELYLGHVNKLICTLSESASESVRCSISAYYQNWNRNRHRNRSQAVETHHKASGRSRNWQFFQKDLGPHKEHIVHSRDWHLLSQREFFVKYSKR